MILCIHRTEPPLSTQTATSPSRAVLTEVVAEELTEIAEAPAVLTDEGEEGVSFFF